MKGLHVCKAGNEPQVGQIKTFIIAGNRIKSKKSEEGGTPYKITSVNPKEDYTDSYGNVAFNIEIEPASSGEGERQPVGSNHGSGSSSARTGTMSQSDYWSAKNERDIESNRRQGRAHSQHMALLYFQMVGGFPEGFKPQDAIRQKTDFFELDKDRHPKETPDEEGVY